FGSIPYAQNLTEANGGAEGDLGGRAGGRDELIVRHKSDRCEILEPIEPEREIAAAYADCEFAGFAVPRGIAQVAAVCVQGRSPGDLPGRISCRVQTGVDFAHHLLLG